MIFRYEFVDGDTKSVQNSYKYLCTYSCYIIAADRYLTNHGNSSVIYIYGWLLIRTTYVHRYNNYRNGVY